MKRFAVLSGLTLLLASPGGAVEVKKDGWLFPNPARAVKKDVRTFDYTPRIPGRETKVTIYQRNKDGVVFETLEIEGETYARSEEHTSELQSLTNLVCRLLHEEKK